MVSAQASIKKERNVEDDTIVLDSTEEFCRQIGEEEQQEESESFTWPPGLCKAVLREFALDNQRQPEDDEEDDNMVSLICMFVKGQRRHFNEFPQNISQVLFSDAFLKLIIAGIRRGR